VRSPRLTWLLILCVIGFVAPLRADDYRGRTLRIVVGSSAGGGYDREARLVARHLSRHIPGSPRVVVDNVPGAGGLIAANTFARVTVPDGLTLGYFPLGVLSAQLLGNPAVHYDVTKFEIIGSPYPDRTVCVFPASTGITTLERWRTSPRPLKLGSTGRDSIMHVFPALLAGTLGIRSQIINGYKGTTEVRLAIASGELDGACQGWGGVKAGWPDRRAINVVVQSGTDRHPELPDVPAAVSFATNPDAAALLGTTTAAMSLGARFYAFPPGTSASARSTLTEAFLATMRDPGYVREAAAAGISNEPVDGDVLLARIEALLSLPQPLITQLRQMIAR
jgi:tripartite-type tricarboxylate transporter receptor subunit TctC